MSRVGSAGRLTQPPRLPQLQLSLSLRLLLLLVVSASAQAPIPAPPPPVALAPVGVNLPQYPSFIGLAAEIRRGIFSRRTSLEQLDVWPHNDSITVHGETHQLDENGTVTIGKRLFKVSGDGVAINGVWFYPAPPTEEPHRRRKPEWGPLPSYDGGPFSSVQLGAVLGIAVPAAATMLMLLLCCLACTHRSCWCCGLCDGKLSATDIRKLFDSDDDKQSLTV